MKSVEARLPNDGPGETEWKVHELKYIKRWNPI